MLSRPLASGYGGLAKAEPDSAQAKPSDCRRWFTLRFTLNVSIAIRYHLCELSIDFTIILTSASSCRSRNGTAFNVTKSLSVQVLRTAAQRIPPEAKATWPAYGRNWRACGCTTLVHLNPMHHHCYNRLLQRQSSVGRFSASD